MRDVSDGGTFRAIQRVRGPLRAHSSPSLLPKRSPHLPQIEERKQRVQMRRVLGLAEIAHRHLPELALDDTERAPHLGADACLHIFELLHNCTQRSACTCPALGVCPGAAPRASPESASTPMCTFMPKCHWLPFFVWCILGSRSLHAAVVGRTRCGNQRGIDHRIRSRSGSFVSCRQCALPMPAVRHFRSFLKFCLGQTDNSV